MHRHFIFVALSLLICSLSVITGCGYSDLGAVTGKVTLDGVPVEGATLEFQPDEEGASPSIGITDAAGEYTLKYTRDSYGAKVGTHKVRITLPTTSMDENGVETIVPQPIPARYNSATTLVSEVKPGSNTFDFELEKGK